jgi:hypothetical protein
VAISIKTAVAIGSGLLVLGAGVGVAALRPQTHQVALTPTTAPTIAPTPGQSAAAD